MLTISSQTRIFMALEATDMRKGFDGLCGLVSDTLQHEPPSGALLLFINRRRYRMKVLYWEVDGLAIWYRRLSKEHFRSLPQTINTSRSRFEATSLPCYCEALT